MSGFDPVESKEPKVEVEDTENLAHDERHKTGVCRPGGDVWIPWQLTSYYT